jgi:hypothetical protein
MTVEISDFQSQTFRHFASAFFSDATDRASAAYSTSIVFPDSLTPHQAYGYLIGQDSNLLGFVLDCQSHSAGKEESGLVIPTAIWRKRVTVHAADQFTKRQQPERKTVRLLK